MRIRKLTLATLACLLLWTVAAAATPAQKEQALKVGKRGEITLTQPTKVGNVVLQPDTYVIQHRVSGDHHFVRFVELKQMQAEVMGDETIPYTYTEQDKVGEIPCRVVPAPGPIKETTAYIVTKNGMPRITKVAIKGENVFHILIAQ